MRAFGAALAGRFAPGELRAPLTAHVHLFPHQLEAALAIIRGQALRLLLADEVGLGKTIQAGLVCAEMRLRGLGDRILILTPAGLRAQWADELRGKFGLDAEIVDSATLERRVASLPQGLNPWTPPAISILSIDFAKHPELLGPLSAIRWDVLVVDEAHGVASAPERSKAARQLASRSRVVLLATATPHNGDETAFRALCGTGKLPGEGPIAVVRRSRADIGLTGRRRTSILRVRSTPAEARMHHLLGRYLDAVWREAAGRSDRRAQLAMVVLWKRGLSSAASLEASLSRRLAALDSAPRHPVQAALPLTAAEQIEADLDSSDDVSPDILGAPGLLDAATELKALAGIVHAATAAAVAESKVEILDRFLSRVDEPAIVFTEYRDTLERLHRSLGRHGPCACIHGGLPPGERHEVCRDFSKGRLRLLLATDAAGEGLNLHACCRLVINMELPWNPMRLEQRAGRVDRLDQKRTAHVVHLVARDTAEVGLLSRLIRRVDAARSGIGDVISPLGAIREEDLAAELLGLGTTARDRDAGVRSDTVRLDLRAAGRAEARRLVEARKVLGRLAGREASRPVSEYDRLVARETAAIDASGPLLTIIRCRGKRQLPSGLLCICRVRLFDLCGAAIEECVVPIQVNHFDSTSQAHTCLKRRLRQEFSSASAAVMETATTFAHARAIAQQATLAAFRRLPGEREHALDLFARQISSLGRQPGLFDHTVTAPLDLNRPPTSVGPMPTATDRAPMIDVHFLLAARALP